MVSEHVAEANNPRKIRNIIIHCTAGNQYEKLTDLVAFFKKKGWKNPGYHYVVEADGKVTQILSELKIANGVLGHNNNSIQVSYMGGVDLKNKLKPIDNRTDKQKKALWDTVSMLKGKYPKAKVSGHRDFSPDGNHDGIIQPSEWIKACPCFEAKEEYAIFNK